MRYELRPQVPALSIINLGRWKGPASRSARSSQVVFHKQCSHRPGLLAVQRTIDNVMKQAGEASP